MAPSNRSGNTTTIIQWNCRGIKEKVGELQQFIATLDPQPDIIALQEVNSRTHLPGYVTYTDPTGKATATLVRKNVAATQHLTSQKGCEHTLIEVHSSSTKQKGNLFVLNAYCRPSNKKPGIQDTIQETLNLAKDQPALILGDFNAPHQMWGYRFNSMKGKEIVTIIDQNRLTLLNEPHVATRIGTSTSRDTCPDLSLLAGSIDIAWTNTQVSLGSDHEIIKLTVKDVTYKAHIGFARITDWDKFRKTRASREKNPGSSYDDWAAEIMKDCKTHTQTIATTYLTPHVDTRLLHLWEARRSLTRRWKRQRHNKKLRKKIAQINKQAAEYALSLCKENWLQLCDGLPYPPERLGFSSVT